MIKKLKEGQLPTPAREKGNVPIVMACSESYLPYTCVAIFSLLEHGDSKRFYDILLLYQQNYSAAGLVYLERVTAQWDNCNLRLIDVQQWLSHNPHVEGHISRETYARLLLPDLMQHYTEVIYLDGDLVVCHDVADLLTPAPPGTLLSGVVDLDVVGQYHGPEWSMRYYLDKKLGLKKPDTYLQAGVLVFHIPALRAALGSEMLTYIKKGYRLRYFDQDILNSLCNGYVNLLDLRWNVVSDCDSYRVAKIISNVPELLHYEYLQSREEPWIVHFSGHQKPWNDLDADLGKFFWNAAERAGILDLIPQRKIAIKTESLPKRFFARVLPKQSRRRELCKIIWFSFKYRRIKCKKRK